MSTVKEFIESGVLELYAMGQTTPAQTQEVERMAAFHPDVRAEIESIREALEAYATAHAVEPSPIVKYMTMAAIDFMSRLENGERLSFPPLLHDKSTPADYAEWLNRDDLKPALPLNDVHVRIIGYSPRSDAGDRVVERRGATGNPHERTRNVYGGRRVV